MLVLSAQNHPRSSYSFWIIDVEAHMPTRGLIRQGTAPHPNPHQFPLEETYRLPSSVAETSRWWLSSWQLTLCSVSGQKVDDRR